MFPKTSEVKVMRDPVHGYIHVDYQAVWQIIDSRWFQRLRRIHQLGGAYMVYHTADHTRFSHSLGVYEIVRRMVTEVPDISNALNEREKLTVMLIGIDSFSDYDLARGREKADLLIKTYADALREIFGTEGTYRYSEAEFLILMRGRRDQFLEKLMQFRSITLKQKTAGTDMAAVTFCAGHVHATLGGKVTDIRGILHEADDLLREARARGAGTILGKESRG